MKTNLKQTTRHLNSINIHLYIQNKRIFNKSTEYDIFSPMCLLVVYSWNN